VVLLLVASAVAVALAGLRGKGTAELTLGPVRQEASTPTSSAPTTTMEKGHAKTAPRQNRSTSQPKAHASARPGTRKKPSTKPAKKPSRPQRAAATGFVPARTWSWEPQSRARRYVFTLQRNGTRMIAARTTKPHYVLPKRFRFAAGRYRWRVVALTTKRGARRKLVVDSRFRLSRAGAAAANG
jgi:hypothetical protein